MAKCCLLIQFACSVVLDRLVLGYFYMSYHDYPDMVPRQG